MNHYGVLFPAFWTGQTGRLIAQAGGRCAQLVALYLMANPDATMIGLYPLEIAVVQARVRSLKTREITLAFEALSDVQFADFDQATGVVWVREMAKFRLGLHLKPLKADDKRVTHCQRLYANAKPNAFLGPFFNRYEIDLHLKTNRGSEGASKGLIEGASKGLRSQITDNSNQKIKIEQEDQEQRALARDSRRVLVKLAHGVMDEIDAGRLPAVEAKDELKARASRARIVYDATECNTALDVAEAQRRREVTA